MEKYATLHEIVEFMRHRHPGIKVKVGGGCYAMKFLRTPSGARIPFEEIKGFRLIDFHTSENTVIIDQLACGLSFKGAYTQTMSARLILQDLVIVNVYDHQTDFFSLGSIDFTYMEKTKDAQAQLLAHWENPSKGDIRAQWTRDDPDIDRLLDQIGCHPVIQQVVQFGRNIDM